MQKVVMTNPNWLKGYIDKYLVVPMNCEYITPILNYDPEAMSHIQYAGCGNYIFRVRHYLDRSGIEETQFFVSADNQMLVVKRLTITDAIANHLEAMRDPAFKLFSIFRGLDMSVYELFDCDIESRTEFLKPLKTADSEMFDFIVENLKFSRNLDCETNWSGAVNLPRWLNSRERLITDNTGNTVVNTSEHWLIFHEDGSVTFPELSPTKGAHINFESKRTLEVYTNAPVPMPPTAVKAIKIILGANPVGDSMQGVSWNLYKRNKR